MANPIHQSGSGKAQRGGTCDPVGTVSEAREEDLQTEKMDIAPTNTSSCVKASERVESGVNEVNEVQASVSGGHERVNEVQAPVSVGHVRVSEAVPGAGGTERECGGVQGGEVGGAMGVGAAHVLAEVRQGQVDQGPSEAVEVESVQVGGQANPTNFWEKRRLFPVPDFSDNDPFKRKNWVKVKWEGNKEGAPPRRFFVRKVLLDGMGFSSDDLSAVIGQTESEYDITFKLPEVLDHFWRIYNLQKRAGHPDWENLIVIPMTKPETKNITIMMKNDAIPQEDILVWLQRQCTVVSPLVKIFDEDNVWGGGWRTQVKLNVTGNVPTHLPNSFFIGKEKGTCFYVGQPRRCFKCGARDHLAKACTVLRCALCNAVGHEANSCNRVRCNLCNRMGHSHRRCPEAYHNIVRLFPEIDREMRKVMEPVDGEQEPVDGEQEPVDGEQG
uniref:CCHC-type domain-containing protein n=1 Tax=Xenopus tropicalis TaxID=8364 RepID=A0A803J6W3_XENTR